MRPTPLTLTTKLIRAAPIERIRDEFSPMRDRDNAGQSEAAMTRLFAEYRPERHYMRGPGPKWIEKHVRIECVGAAAPEPASDGFVKALARRLSVLRAQWAFRSRDE
jgi:hypothetical protein